MVVLQKNREDVEENLQIINNKPRNQSHDFKERGGNPETVGGDKEAAYSEADPPELQKDLTRIPNSVVPERALPLDLQLNGWDESSQEMYKKAKKLFNF